MPSLVSVVIPCFNAAATLAQTLDSVLAQTFTNLDIIAVDDSSTDGTAAVLAAYAARDSRVRLIRQANGGCAASRNTGIRAARGDFIGLIDADDLWDPSYVAVHLARFSEDARLGVSFTPIRYMNNDGSPSGEVTRPKLDGITAADILCDNPCGCAMMVARRAVFDEVGLFNDTIRRAEDQEWLFRVALTRWTIGGVDALLADYRNSPTGLSADLDAQFQTYLDLLARFEALSPHVVRQARARAEGSMLLYCARRALRLGQPKSVVRRFLLRALQRAPRLLVDRPRATLGLLAVACMPERAGRLLEQRA